MLIYLHFGCKKGASVETLPRLKLQKWKIKVTKVGCCLAFWLCVLWAWRELNPREPTKVSTRYEREPIQARLIRYKGSMWYYYFA